MRVVSRSFLVPILLCVTSALLPRPAIAADPVAQALEGAWLVSVANQPRERFMIVSGVKVQRGEITVDSATYGYIDKPGDPMKSWKGQVLGDALDLSLVTPGDSLVSVRMRMDETTVSGTFVFKGGATSGVRMTRVPQEELDELRAAAKRAKSAAAALQRERANLAKASARKPHANASSRIYLVYVGAADCTACWGYEAEYFGRKDLMAKVVPDFPKITYVKAGLGTYKSRAPLGRVPPELSWLAEPDKSGKPHLRRRGVPFFALVVDDKVWAQGHGTVALETLLAPEIKRAVAEKNG